MLSRRNRIKMSAMQQSSKTKPQQPSSYYSKNKKSSSSSLGRLCSLACMCLLVLGFVGMLVSISSSSTSTSIAGQMRNSLSSPSSLMDNMDHILHRHNNNHREEEKSSEEEELSEEESERQSEKTTPLSKEMSSIIAKYKNCQVQHWNKTLLYENQHQELLEENEPNNNYNHKPLWFPSFPNSIDDLIMKHIATKLTGYGRSAARSFYSRQKGKFRDCQGEGKVAICMVVHPLVEMKPPPTGRKYTENFHSNVVYAIRNPLTVIPAFHNGKAIRYHNQIGQVPEQDWRQFRDEHLETTVTQWKDQLRAWKKMTTHDPNNSNDVVDNNYYNLRLYLPYEKLMNRHDGILLLQRFMDILHFSGMEIVLKDDGDIENLSCLWYSSLGRELLENHDRYGYEYTDYVPGYTEEQKEYLLREMKSFMDENEDDPKLVAILKSYHEYIRDHTRIDVPYVAAAAENE